MSLRRSCLLPALALALTFSSRAWADAGPKIRDSLWVPVGLNVGYGINPEPLANGLVIGPEVSFVYLDKSLLWGGVYTDLLYDAGSDTTRASVGGEVGVAILGLDLGYVRSLGAEGQNGARGRLMLSVGAVHLYGGLGWALGDPETHAYGEVGLLLKYPIRLWEAESDHARLRPAPHESDGSEPGYSAPNGMPLAPIADP